MKTSTRIRLIVALVACTTWAAGCGGASDENLSVRAEADPARLRAARAEADAAAEGARKAEAAKTKGAFRVEEP